MKKSNINYIALFLFAVVLALLYYIKNKKKIDDKATSTMTEKGLEYLQKGIQTDLQILKDLTKNG